MPRLDGDNALLRAAGGVPDPARTTRGRYALGLTGCVADLALGEDLDFRVRLDAPSGESTNVAACG